MRNLKKFLALALAMLMLVACFSVSAFDDTKDSDYAEAIQLLSDLQVIRGFNENEFKPNEDVTRWQMALMITKLKTGKVEETDARWYDVTNTTPFTDLVVDQYYGSIGYCYSNRIIIGATATTFEPARGITFEEALAMVVRSLGYNSDEMNAGYPWSYVEKAVALGLDENLENVGYEATLTRGQTAQLLFNALTAETADGTTFAKAAFNLTQAVIVLTATNKVNVLGGEPVLKNGYVQFRTLDEYGQLGTVAYHCQATELGITDTAEKYLYYAYEILTQDDFASFIKVAAVDTATTTAVKGANNSRITIDGKTYKLVDKYTSLNNKPTNKYTEPEIILRDENDAYALMTEYEVAAVYPEIVTFDINKDGAPDAGLYKDYSFGVYKSTYVNDVDGMLVELLVKGSQAAVVGAKPAANDYIRYSYNGVSNVLYVGEVAEKVSGLYTGVKNNVITMGGADYEVGIKDFQVPSTAYVTDMLGKKGSIYLLKDPAGKQKVVVIGDDYAGGGTLVVYDSYICLNQIGYPQVYAYVGSNLKSVISVQSVDFETYQNYIYATYSAGASYWYSDFLNTAARGDAFWGTHDLNNTYYDLSSAEDKLILVDNGGVGHFNSTTSFVLGGKTVTVTKDTVYIVVDKSGDEPLVHTYKGTASKAGDAFTVNAGAEVYVTAGLVYISDGNFNANSGITFNFNGAASNTVIYLDEDAQLTAAQGINSEDGGFIWTYTYTNVIDAVYGGLLSYDIVSYGQKLPGKGFYVVEQGVVTQKLVEDVDGNFVDEDGNVVIFYVPSGDATTTMSNTGNSPKVNNKTYALSASANKYLYVMLDDGNVKNDSATSVVPKNYGTNAVVCGALSTHAKYAYNYELLAGFGCKTTDVVIFSVYHTDFDGIGFPSAGYRNYVPYNCGAQITASAANMSYTEYLVFAQTNLTGDTNWDRLRKAAGVEATGEQDVTAAVKLYTNEGFYMDPAVFGLTFTVMDNLYGVDVNDTMRKASFLKIHRNPYAPFEGEISIPRGSYIVYEYDGSTYVVDYIPAIYLAGFDAFLDIFEGFSAVAGQNKFVTYIDAVAVEDLDLTIDEVMAVLAKAPIYLYKGADKFSNVTLFGTYNYITGSTQYSIDFIGSLNFEAGTNYDFEINYELVAPQIVVA